MVPDSSVVPRDRMRSNSHKLNHKKCHLNMRKNLFTPRVADEYFHGNPSFSNSINQKANYLTPVHELKPPTAQLANQCQPRELQHPLASATTVPPMGPGEGLLGTLCIDQQRHLTPGQSSWPWLSKMSSRVSRTQELHTDAGAAYLLDCSNPADHIF
ncbi:hypothetical protein BTVI_15628 [Pitangus sulphuratus]|nr:hypothetical protein BTVI_15628 [Pitangus sulphuratus]